MTAILPGSTIGILGGGQLGRMLAMSARSFGYRVQVMDPDPSCPARFVVDACFEGPWNDTRAAADLARGSDVVTLEIEQLSLDCLDAAAKYAPVRPGAAMLGIIQDRILQKNWLRDHGLPLGDYRAAESEQALVDAVTALGGRCFIKSARGGYDGRGQVKIGFGELTGTPEEQAREAWKLLGQRPVVAEKAVALEREVSVMVARRPSGETRSFPSALNHHENQILVWSVIPSGVPPALEKQAQELASAIADQFTLEGLLAIEMFVTTDGKLLVNELAPRPHNSYHASERACVTSQFEQGIRAVCDLPLGDVAVVQPAAIVNLLGDLWLDGDGQQRTPRFDLAMAVPGLRLHLYEKHSARKGRKMGHLSSVGATPEEAVARVLEAEKKLKQG
ncbi:MULTISPECIES: 5-(carboxyamino)imidazole ribonucleotide synthase [Acidobacterium]|uniref:N5-carboxyaminoimidazole ribonucleotide synthase n=1 Tax=Acidobacterium capsulatum (strain ATCC 51196 / DSM 11244 / BCRC 80197 / JCM 7670 / NBRC 15755 / NCIMB 13165 / 161) TaxID=240015 RepID=C1FAF6_ACIC5|nr:MULTISPECIES: 5-(carboxyamino)imidazole ribonucleotide synthase [Acidobacterium]ACO32178.1 phosphoribosylaminoimidazole carboxylase, ATPase subunit [Acidobacterium capsulatum ATCC 51196]HCT62390.1 5-(carboxyamino)imidazole ribonucleotide synthase [Acidobacterium sp.]